MKKNIKFITILLLILLIMHPLNAHALTKQTSYVNINDTQNLEVGSLSFSEISFKDYSSTSTQAFGLTSIIRNSSKNDINYTSTINYYDSSYNLVTQVNNSGNAITETSNFNVEFKYFR